MSETGTFTIASRFCGPPNSGNGGYVCGVVSTFADRPVRVRLRKPPPLETPLAVHRRPGGRLEVMHGELLIAEAEPYEFTLELPEAPSYAAAREASRNYIGHHHHPFPTCFVCGPQRAQGDGLRIFPAPYGDKDLVIGPWNPDASLGDAEGLVQTPFMWAALDCPGWFAATHEARAMLLGQMAAHVERRVRVSENCVCVGWKLSQEGRKHVVGTAVFDEAGNTCGWAIATWIEPAAGAGSGG